VALFRLAAVLVAVVVLLAAFGHRVLLTRAGFPYRRLPTGGGQPYGAAETIGGRESARNVGTVPKSNPSAKRGGVQKLESRADLVVAKIRAL